MTEQHGSPDGRWGWDGPQGRPSGAGQPPHPMPGFGGQPPSTGPAVSPYPGAQPPFAQQPPYAAQPPFPNQPSYPNQPPFPNQPPYGMPGFGGPGPGAPGPFTSTPGPKRGKPWWIAGVAVVVVGAIVGTVISLSGGSGGHGSATKNAASGASAGNGKTLQPGQPVTTRSLGSVDPTSFLVSILKRQMTAPVTEVTAAYFETADELTSHSHYYVNDVTTDYATKAFNYQTVSYDNNSPDDLTRCVNGVTNLYDTYAREWNALKTSTTCTSLSVRVDAYLSDGIAPGGMTQAQATKYIDSFVAYKGFVNAQRPTLVTSQGKPYVRMVVDFKPVQLQGDYWGSQIFTWAFKDAGLNPLTYPFQNKFGISQGMHVVYYLDPRTLMPVYCKQTAITSPGQSPYYTALLFKYAFPATLQPETTDDHTPPTISDVPQLWTMN